MKLSLPIKSKPHESRIKEIADIIYHAGKDKIAFVILFGSFARGNWVRYRHVEQNIVYEYASDYDFLVITKSGKQANSSAAFDLERKIKKEIDSSTQVNEAHRSHIIIESITNFNNGIKKSQYFFSDIKEEGIILYSCGNYEIANPENLENQYRKELSKSYYQHWFEGAKCFLIDYQNALSRCDYKRAIFYLHQATESFYNCTLLTIGGYKPKSHNLEELNQLCTVYSHDFLTIFPQASLEEKKCFEILQQSYIEARYNNNFQIDITKLQYLFNQITKLEILVKKICEDKINQL